MEGPSPPPPLACCPSFARAVTKGIIAQRSLVMEALEEQAVIAKQCRCGTLRYCNGCKLMTVTTPVAEQPLLTCRTCHATFCCGRSWCVQTLEGTYKCASANCTALVMDECLKCRQFQHHAVCSKCDGVICGSCAMKRCRNCNTYACSGCRELHSERCARCDTLVCFKCEEHFCKKKQKT
jgi:hypothetical protein